MSLTFTTAVRGTGLRHRQIAYGHHVDQVAEFVAPATGSRLPLVVVVHGGFWRQQYDRTHTVAQCLALARAGLVAAALEYRRVGGNGGWPATFLDVATGVDALPGLLDELIDPDRVILMGHSAGGHLALWAGSRHRLPPDAPGHRDKPSPLRGVLALGAAADLGWVQRTGGGGGAAADLVGVDPEHDPEGRWADADPARLVPTGTPTILLHGQHDDAVPIACANSYTQAAQAAGDPCRLQFLPGVGHFEFLDPRTSVWPHVLAAAAELLETFRN